MAVHSPNSSKTDLEVFGQSPHSLRSKPPVFSAKTPTWCSATSRSGLLVGRLIIGEDQLSAMALGYDAGDVVLDHRLSQ